jgi:hypothetical protein
VRREKGSSEEKGKVSLVRRKRTTFVKKNSRNILMQTLLENEPLMV